MKNLRLPVLLLGAALAVTACGSVEDTAGSSGNGSSGGSTSASASGSTAAPDDTATDAAAITVTDARGEDVTLDAPASAVVGLEWGVIENLVSLGVMPVGVADVTGYTNWVSAAPLDDSVTDVGMRGEPSVDALVALDPDLVVATTDLAPNIVEQIEEFVPVLVVRAAAAERPMEQMRENLRLVAQAVGRTAEGNALLADLDEALQAGASDLAAAGLEGAAFAMADGWAEGNTVSVRAFTDTSLVGAVGEQLGLTSAWELDGDPDYGLATTDVEGLTNLGDVHFVYYDNEAAGSDAFGTLDGNPIWEGLDFVTAGHVHRLPDGIWMFGGPRSVEQFIDGFVDAMTA